MNEPINSSNNISFNRYVSYFLFAMVLGTVAIRYAIPLRDSDVWFHLSYGKYFVNNLTLMPDHTIYSWTPASNETIYCTWLPDIILYGLYSLGGVPALLAFRYSCLLVFVMAITLYAKKVGVLSLPTTWLICLVGILMSSVPVYCKPEIVSYVLMILVVWNWWHIRTGGKDTWKNCYLFPLITLIWMNSHGGVVFGFLFIGVIFFSELLNGINNFAPLAEKSRKHFFISLCCCFLTLFITPYGFNYPIQLITSLIPTKENMAYALSIAAYGSPFGWFNNPTLDMGDLANFTLILILLITLPLVRKKKIEWSFLLTNVVFAFLFTRFHRTTFYWVPVVFFGLLYLLSFRPSLLFPSRKVGIIFQSIVIVILSIFLSGKASYDLLTRPPEYVYFGLDKGEFSPYLEADFIEKNFPNYNIGNTYEDGAYLAWKLWPSNKIMMDARQFPFKSWFFDYLNSIVDPKYFSNFVQRFPCDIWCVNLKYHSLLIWFQKSSDWELAFVGASSAVYVKKSLLDSRPLPQVTFQAFKELKSPHSLLRGFLFSLMLEDWKACDMIIARMDERAWQPDTKKMATKSKFTRDLYYAYAHHDYQLVAKLLPKDDARETKEHSAMLANSWLFLGEDFWGKQELKRALDCFIKAHEIFPSKYSLYNIAVAMRALSAHTETGQEKNILHGPPWKVILFDFMQIKSGEGEAKLFKFQDTAKAMVSDEYREMGLPLLFLPEKILLEIF